MWLWRHDAEHIRDAQNEQGLGVVENVLAQIWHLFILVFGKWIIY
jgi:hypothetical protein